MTLTLMRTALCVLLISGLCEAANRVNKHTYSSNDGEADYKFVSEYFCDADTDSADFKCAIDMKATCDGFDIHMVQSFVTANGTETPDEWYSYISSLHGDMSEWDQFMHYGTTFEASQLDSHLEKFQADEVPVMTRKSSSTDDSSTTYSLVVQTPSGKVMEIVSGAKPSQSDTFTAWTEDECPQSHARKLSTQGRSAAARTSSSLAALTAIGVNIAATQATVDQIGPWLTKYSISGSKSTTSSSGNCSFATITYDNAEVRYVSNTAARIGSKTVEDYEEYQMSLHSEYVGQNSGWDAFMDNHWCVGVDHKQYLDTTAKLWAKDNVSWHGHKSPRVSSVRSVGLRGESIELNGEIDGSYLEHLKGFDFCTASTDPE